MSQRFESLAARLRGLLLGAGWSAGILWFWLGSNDAFEGPKTQAALVYGLALAACSWPLLVSHLAGAWRRRRPYLATGGALVLATLASWAGALACLPSNLALPLERTVPLLVAAFSALVFLLEDAPRRRRALFVFLTAHCVLLFYGLIQVLDQEASGALGRSVDLIRWVRFGESRVYSTLGNPDYMAAHLSLLLALWLGLGWRRLDPRGPAQAAALALAVAPLVLGPAAFGWAAFGDFARASGPWFLVCALLFAAARLCSPRACWGLLLALCSGLIVLAQGRGAWLAVALSALAMAAGGGWLKGPAFFTERRRVLAWPLAAALLGALLGGGLLAARAADPQAAWTKAGLRRKVLDTADALGRRLAHIFDKADDAQVVRRFYWQAAWRMGLEHPLLGVGYGNHAMFTARYQSQVWKAWDAAGDPRAALVEPHVELYTHNDVLQNFAETGALGLAAFIAFWGLFVFKSWRLAGRGARAGDSAALELGLGLLGLAVAFAANAMTNFPWRVLATQQLCWLAFAVLALGEESLALAASPAGTVGGASTSAASPPKPFATPAWAWGLGAALALALALFPVRWFVAGALLKQAGLRKDDPSVDVQVQGIPFYERAVQAGLSGTQRVEAYLYLGGLYNVAQRPDLAKRCFEQGVHDYPDFLEAWYNLGYTAQARYAAGHQEADRAEAVADYQRVLETDPRAVNALNNLGNLAYGAGDWDGSRKVFETLLRYQPASVEAHYNLAAVWVRKNDKARAAAELEAALKLKPDFDPALKLLAALRRLGVR